MYLLQWFPGISNVTAEKPGPTETGKRFEEYTEYPIIGKQSTIMFRVIWAHQTHSNIW